MNHRISRLCRLLRPLKCRLCCPRFLLFRYRRVRYWHVGVKNPYLYHSLSRVTSTYFLQTVDYKYWLIIFSPSDNHKRSCGTNHAVSDWLHKGWDIKKFNFSHSLFFCCITCASDSRTTFSIHSSASNDLVQTRHNIRPRSFRSPSQRAREVGLLGWDRHYYKLSYQNLLAINCNRFSVLI